FAVGIVSRFLGKDATERRVYINILGPFWDAMEVWLITAVVGVLAAFPLCYATMSSGFYILLVFMLVALVMRYVALPFAALVDSHGWRNFWYWSLVIGSFLPPILWGVVLANFMIGMPIDQDMEMVGGFIQFLNPFALLGGIMFLLLTITHGLQFITI